MTLIWLALTRSNSKHAFDLDFISQGQ